MSVVEVLSLHGWDVSALLVEAAEAWTRALGHELGKAGGGAQVIRVMALYTDAELAANPGKDYGAWTHVDALGDQIAAVFA